MIIIDSINSIDTGRAQDPSFYMKLKVIKQLVENPGLSIRFKKQEIVKLLKYTKNRWDHHDFIEDAFAILPENLVPENLLPWYRKFTVSKIMSE